MRGTCEDLDLLSRRVLDTQAGKEPGPGMMVYSDPQWNCSTATPMLQLYDDVGYRGKCI